MIQKLRRISFFAILAVLVISSAISMKVSKTYAATGDNGDNPLELIIKESSQNEKEQDELSLKDIFGDEQTFPFVAGFGKNSGKD